MTKSATRVSADKVTFTQTEVTSAIASGSTVAGSEMTWATATVPTGWLEENGAAISRSTYSALFAVIGTEYGVGDGSSTFNLPDARGEFIRGWAHGSANDPDRAARTNRGDGTTGDVVGSKQADVFKSHDHTRSAYDGSSHNGYLRYDHGTASSPHAISNTGSTGDNETRPRNTNRMIIIKY